MRAIAWVVCVLTLHTAWNTRLLRRPSASAASSTVSVLLPVRDEVHRVEACLDALRDQAGVDEVLVLDDGSSDGTAALVEKLGFRLLIGADLPAGWLGKPYACQQLADAADPRSEVLVFLDADVVLAPGAVAASVATLLDAGLDLVCPYPRQQAPGLTRLVQPLLQWSFLTFLPLRLAERSPLPSLAAANGQLLVIRRDAYDRLGGHAAVRDQVVEDVALLRQLKRAGGRGGVIDGTALATTRMYDGWPELVEGYTKSLHTVPPLVPVLLLVLYVVPWLGRSRSARIACAAGIVGRMITARRTGGRQVDAVTHPLGVALLVGLHLRSRLSSRRTWKGRPV